MMPVRSCATLHSIDPHLRQAGGRITECGAQVGNSDSVFCVTDQLAKGVDSENFQLPIIVVGLLSTVGGHHVCNLGAHNPF